MLSSIWANVGGYSIIIFERMLGYLFLFIMIARICTTRERVNGVALTLIVSHLWLLVMNPEVVLAPTTRHYISGATFLGDGNDYSMSLCILLGFAAEYGAGADAQDSRKSSAGSCWAC